MKDKQTIYRFLPKIFAVDETIDILILIKAILFLEEHLIVHFIIKNTIDYVKIN